MLGKYVTLPSVLRAALLGAALFSILEITLGTESIAALRPVREDAHTLDGITLGIRHYSRPGAVPVLLLHGFTQNDRCWDPQDSQYSFAQFLYDEGFDVWVGNLRGAGTPDFRSEAPAGPEHWTVDEHASYDLPALLETVQSKTHQAPFIVAHSMGAWVVEGYLAGVHFDEHRHLIPSPTLGRSRQESLRGVATIGGLYTLTWEHRLADAISHPILTEEAYFRSNYELELLAEVKFLYQIIPYWNRVPLGWVRNALNLPLERIPVVGNRLRALYQGLQTEIIESPMMSMFLNPKNEDPNVLRLHLEDGLEDMPPRLLEQIGNAYTAGKTSSYYHIERNAEVYDYGDIRPHLDLPMLFIAGGRDRLASGIGIYQEGFLKTQSTDKQFIWAEDYGHMDILMGYHAKKDVMMPVARWLKEHIEN